jgi:hypothetical protein
MEMVGWGFSVCIDNREKAQISPTRRLDPGGALLLLPLDSAAKTCTF